MGREQRRKQDKNYKHKVSDNNDIQLFTVSGTVKTIAALAGVLLISYFILAFFVTKEMDFNKKDDNNTTEDSSSSVSNQILASNIFSQQEESYYVYFYDFNDEDEKISSSISNNSNTIYRVNTASGFNKNYVTEGSGNKSAKDLSSLKVINPTLIKVSNDTIVEYYEGVSSILSALNK